jgi:hypothetical protein
VGYATVEKIAKTNTISPGLYGFVIKVSKNITITSLLPDVVQLLTKTGSLLKKEDII